MTPRDLSRLAGVHPRLVQALTAVFDTLEAEGTPMFVVEGVRTVERQAALYAQGRTAPGPVVTYRDGVIRKSNHQPHDDGLGYAVDSAFAAFDPFAASHPWERYGELLRAQGVTWGGDWAMRDLPHAELTTTT